MRAKFNSIRQHGDVRYFSSGAKFKLLKSATQILSGLLLMWYLLNFTEGHYYGKFRYALSWVEMLSLFSFVGIGDSIARSVAKGYPYSFVRGTRVAMAISLSGSVVLAAGAGYYYWEGGGLDTTAAMVICALLFPLYLPLANYTQYLNGVEQFDRDSIYSTILYAGRVAATMAVAFFFPSYAWLALLAYLLSHAGITGYFFRRCAARITETRVDPELLSYATFITLVSGVIMIESRFDHVIVGSLGGEALLEIYLLGMLPYSKLRTVLSPALSVFTARFANGTMALTYRKILYLLMSGVLFSGLSVVVSTLALRYIFPDYSEAVPLAQLCSLVLIVVPPNLTFNVYFRATGNRKAIMVPTLTSRVASLILVLPAWHWAGLPGLIAIKFVEQGVLIVMHLIYWHTTAPADGADTP